MDVTANLTVIAATVVGLGGLALAGWAICKLLAVIEGLIAELRVLAIRKPYYLVETDDQGIRTVQHLQDQVSILQAELHKPQPEIPAPLERAVKLANGGEPVPPMADPDLVLVGERG